MVAATLLIAVLGLVWGGTAAAGEVRLACPPVEASDYFFPAAVLDVARSDLDAFVRGWYSKHLRVMGEQSLSCGPTSDAETYRFVWLRTFHRPIAVRVSRVSGGGRLVAIELTGHGGYAPGGVANRVEKSVSEADWLTLTAALSATIFWNLPTRPAVAILGADGSQWIIEGRRASEYHVVDRWTPRTGPYREAGLSFLRLAGISVPADDLY
jgi:hypothetical protein